jgi:hypothetical protein
LLALKLNTGFKKLTVNSRAGSKGNGARWNVTCECGNKKVVWAAALLAKKAIKSCGCSNPRNPKGRPITRTDYELMRASLLDMYTGSAAARHLDWDLTLSQFEELIRQNCHYCGDPPSERVRKRMSGDREGKIICNGIDRKDNELGYTVANVLPCCKTCNRAKKDLSYEGFTSYILKAAKHLSATLEKVS